MGLFDSLFGSKAKTTTGQTQTGQQTQQQKTQGAEQTQLGGREVSTETTDQTAQQSQQTQLFDEQTLASLQSLFQQLIGSTGEGGTVLPEELTGVPSSILDFAGILQNRAIGGEGQFSNDIGAILNEARRRGTNELEAATTRAAEGAGSNLNSIVQGAAAQGRADLESQLAALEADLKFRNRKLSSDELLSAFGALTEGGRVGADISLAGTGQGVSNIASIGNLLRGAVAETTGVSTTTGVTGVESEFLREQNTLKEIMDFINQQSGITTQQQGIVKERDSLLDDLTGLISAFGK